ncbi:YhgE/Pip family protein [Psychrobacillus sp. NPDC096426]|uniref:YhgE/Pip family protein n=1 Tax=Psychrobacillus sp. NPDC096426 TaxID=3364491 RepID=UPI003822297E
MIKSEWKHIFTDKKMLISIIAVLFIPVLYAAVYLWAFWDPYANLSNLPVAIVNSDEGADFEGEELLLGDELVNKLKESDQFNFVSVKKEEAEQGLLNREYYLLIEIPENFSRHATTLLDEHPQKMVLSYKANQGSNFLSAQIGETAMERIRTEVNEEVTATYAKQLFDSVTKLGDGFAQASDGAGQLKDGATDLSNGASDLKGYLEQLVSSTVELKDGTNTVASGIQAAADGSSQLNSGLATLSTGATQLTDGIDGVATGAASLKSGIDEYTTSVDKLNESYRLLSEKDKAFIDSLQQIQISTSSLNDSTKELSKGSSEVTSGIEALSEQISKISVGLPEEQAAALTETLKQVQSGSSAITAGLEKLSTGTAALSHGTTGTLEGAVQLNAGYAQAGQGIERLHESSVALVDGASNLTDGTTILATKMNEFNAGVQQAFKGSTNLVRGLSQLANGTSQLQQGTGTLVEKSGELADGSLKLVDGTKELVDGTDSLQTSLQEASDEAKEVNATDETYEMVASPVDVNVEEVNAVPNYGTGLTPYFLSLGLFVGALIISVVFPFVQPAIKPTSGTSWFISKTVVLAVVGILQSLIVVAIVLFGLKLEVESVGMLILIAIITSFTYLAIVQLLVSMLDNPGRFVAILILILQLSTSAGTFPLELIPKPLQIFNKLLPMGYSIQSFRAAISTGDVSYFWYNNSVLIGFMIVCLALTLGFFLLLFKNRYTKQTAEA